MLASMTVRPLIYQQVLEAQSADTDLEDVLQLHEVVLDKDSEGVLGSWTVALGALELGGGGVLAYEKALIGWIFTLSKRDGYVAASRSLGFYRNATSVTIVIASRRGTCRVQMNQACCGTLSRRALIATGSRVAFWILVVTSRICYSSLFAQCSALEGLSTRQVVTVTWDPQPHASVRASSLGGERAQVTDLEQKGKMVKLLSSGWVHVGQRWRGGSQRYAVVSLFFLPPRPFRVLGSLGGGHENQVLGLGRRIWLRTCIGETSQQQPGARRAEEARL
ncbi:hypothetical protein Taro_021370 [Colocasia esculenta]|uniref:Uncharacterized protein n=1 Tax=Colocasia esculenta TaxID=4460 RepID=A0A843UYU5_COLES|nr:hypothetical protein [Colocasia esculenta]